MSQDEAVEGREVRRNKSYALLTSHAARENTVENPEVTDAIFQTHWLQTRKTALCRAILKEFVAQSFYVKTCNGWPQHAKTVHEAAEHIQKEIYGFRTEEDKPEPPAWLFVSCSETLDPEELLDAFQEVFPATRCIHVATSCLGVTSDEGFKTTPDYGTDQAGALAVFAIFDPLGSYCTVGLEPGVDPASMANLKIGLDNAYLELRQRAPLALLDSQWAGGKVGPEPLAEHMIIWLSGLPGVEERAVDAIYEWGHERFHRTIPITGGTAADASIGGKWWTACAQSNGQHVVFGAGKPEGFTVTLIAASVKCFPLFMHPFTPVAIGEGEVRATVIEVGTTENDLADSGRVLLQLRDSAGIEEAAGTMYHRWCEDYVQAKLMPHPTDADGPNSFNPDVLMASTQCPIGIPVANQGDDAFDYRMLHPSGLYNFTSHNGIPAQGAYLKAFASAEADKSEIVLFCARSGDLLSRLGKLREQLTSQIDMSTGEDYQQESASLSPDTLRSRVAGALMVYCAGCMLALQSGKNGPEQMRRLRTSLSTCYGGRPFLAYHPFGEQGFFKTKQKNYHGNLMFAALVFSNDPGFEFDDSVHIEDALMPIITAFGGQSTKDYVVKALMDLLINGEEMDVQRLWKAVHDHAIRPMFLKEVIPCAFYPIPLALKLAHMFHRMGISYTLKRKVYLEASDWFKAFCCDFLHMAPARLLDQGNILSYDVLMQSVRMALLIDAKGVVATNAVQELMDKIWRGNHTLEHGESSRGISHHSHIMRPRAAGGTMRWVSAGDEFRENSFSVFSYFPNTSGRKTLCPRDRHWMHTTCYCMMVVLQLYTSNCDVRNPWLWGCLLVGSASHMVQTLAHKDTGYFTFLNKLDDVLIVIAHASILHFVVTGGDVPRDLDSLSMLLHFTNITKSFAVHSKVGHLIIVVMTMAQDILSFVNLLVFSIFAFFFAFRALFRDMTAVYVGEHWEGPMTVVMNVIWGPEVLWEASDIHTDKTLLLSYLTAMPDSEAVSILNYILSTLAIFTIPILLLNFLIAMMASSYQTVMENADEEYKRSFASCVLVAQDLSILPIPLCVPMDLYRLVNKIATVMVPTKEPIAEEHMEQMQMAVNQLMSLWEARRMIAKLKEPVALDQVHRLQTKIDSLQDKMSVTYSMLSATFAKVAKVNARITQNERFTKMMFLRQNSMNPSNGSSIATDTIALAEFMKAPLNSRKPKSLQKAPHRDLQSRDGNDTIMRISKQIRDSSR